MNDLHDIELRILSQPRLLAVARAALDAAMARLGVPEAERGPVVLAVDEALANVIRHAYHGREDGPIWLRLGTGRTASGPVLRIVIDDAGEQVDPDDIRSRNLEDVRPGGLGVHIIRDVMDEVTYVARSEGGMRLTMIKQFSDSDSGSVVDRESTVHE